MNCYEHPSQAAVAQCPDCGKGLCSQCASAYSIPICVSCNKRRISTERGNIIKELLLTFGVGALLAYFFTSWTNDGHSYSVLSNIIFFIIPFYVFSGIVPGWQTLTRITPAVFLFLPIIGWVLYFVLKLALAVCVGLIMLPVRTVRNISRLIYLQNIPV